MKVFAVLLLSLFLENVFASSAATTAIMSMSAMTSVDQMTKSKKKGFFSSLLASDGLAMEEIMIVTNEDMNNRGAMKIHVVIVYERELYRELSKMSAHEYFRSVDQLIKDHPDQLKILEWELVAEKKVGKWQKVDTYKDNLTPCGAFVFADYNNLGEHRARIPPTYEKVKIICQRSDFNVDYEDKSDGEENEDEDDTEDDDDD